MSIEVAQLDAAGRLGVAIKRIDLLRSALVDMMDAVRIFHGPVAWDIYEKNAPEMKRARAALEEANQ